MISAAQFQKESTIFHSGHKNPIAGDLQTLLNAYEDAGTTPNRKLKLLVLMHFLCQEYFRSKDKSKKAFDPAAHPKNKVVRLMRDIEAEMVSPAFTAQLQRKAAGEHYKGGQLVRGPQPNGTALHGKYQTELIAPRKGADTKYQLQTPVKAFGMSTLYQVLEQEFQNAQGMGPQQSEAAAHAAVAAMTLPEILQKLHFIWSRDANLGVPQFDFFNAAQRQRYEVACVGGVLSCNGQTPYSSQRYGRDDKVMYILDTANHFYIADGIRVGNGAFNHSSMCAGAPVLCAGEVMVNAAGKLIYIDNNSGHYKPDSRALLDAVRFLVTQWALPAGSFDVKNMVTGAQVNGQRFMQKPTIRLVMGSGRQ